MTFHLHFDGLPALNLDPPAHTRPCMAGDSKSRPCRPADCPARRCSAWQLNVIKEEMAHD